LFKTAEPDKNKYSIKLIHKFEEDIQYSSAAAGNIKADSLDNIWFATLPALYKVNAKNLKIEKFIAENCHDIGMNKIYFDNNNCLWIYSSNGLFRFDVVKNEFTSFNTEDGLANEIINGIIDDNRGYLWITTPTGLSKFDKKEENFNNFFRSSDFEAHKFIGITEFDNTQGRQIAFLTSKGFLSYFPDIINKHIPKIVITRFTLFGKEHELDSLIYHKKEIILNYDQNFIAFDFAALDFVDPAKNKYAYKMEGLDKEWTYIDAGNRKANYTNLDDGEYVFRIIASNNDKIWNQAGIAVRIIIIPPWWKTPIAYSLFLIAGVLLFILFIKMRERNLRNEKRILEMKVVERTAEINRQKEEIAAQRDDIEKQRDMIELQKNEVEAQRDIATRQRDQIAKQKQEITDSILYASRIQNAVLPPDDLLSKSLPNHFILFKPRDIVSGDFYWASFKEDKTIIAAADCTGHGVPGAFMSMLGITFLNEILRKEIEDAAQVLDHLKAYVIKSLHQTGKENEAKDGMDIALCIIYHQTGKLEFAGAYNPLYIVRKTANNFPNRKLNVHEIANEVFKLPAKEESCEEYQNYQLIQLKADRMPIGIYLKKKKFQVKSFDFQSGDCLYIFSDGYIDQFGGENGKKLMSKNFKRILLRIQDYNMVEQKAILEELLSLWQNAPMQFGNSPNSQVDDILVIGVKL